MSGSREAQAAERRDGNGLRLADDVGAGGRGGHGRLAHHRRTPLARLRCRLQGGEIDKGGGAIVHWSGISPFRYAANSQYLRNNSRGHLRDRRSAMAGTSSPIDQNSCRRLSRSVRTSRS